METATQVIGRLRAEIRRYLCKEMTQEALAGTLQSLGLDIALTPQGYTLRVSCPAALTPAQEESVTALPKLYAVEPPQRTLETLVIVGDDVECLPGILTELSSVGLLSFQP